MNIEKINSRAGLAAARNPSKTGLLKTVKWYLVSPGLDRKHPAARMIIKAWMDKNYAQERRKGMKGIILAGVVAAPGCIPLTIGP
jgi:hypothetical protein